MDQNPVKITDIITTGYADFLSYCSVSGKVFTSELRDVDYFAFRTIFEKSLDCIIELKIR